MSERASALCLLMLSSCTAFKSSAPPPASSATTATQLEDDDVPISWERDRPTTAPVVMRFNLVNDSVCEVRAKTSPAGIEWRQLPVEVQRSIQAGTVSDDLTAFSDEHGIIDCFNRGCWQPMKLDARGCGVICNSGQRVCLPSQGA